MSADATYVQAPDVLFTSIADGEGIALSVEQGMYHSLNGSAVTLWNAMSTPQTVDTLVASLTAEYQIDSETARADVVAALDDLMAASLVTRNPA